MSKPLQTQPVVEKREVQLLEAPMKKRYAIRPMDHVDSVISAELHNSPPKDDEHVYASPRIPIFHDKKGAAKSFAPVQAVSKEGRNSAIGGWFRTSDPVEIEALDEYCAIYSGDFRKIYPILVAE